MEAGINKLAIVTGATGGIGSSFAKHLAALQYNLLITSHEPGKLEQVAAQLREQYKVAVTTLSADLSVMNDINSLTQYIRELKRIDMLVNCAGYGEKSLFYNETEEAVLKMLSVLVQSTVQIVHATLPVMIAQKSGSIITVSSLAAFIPAPGSSIYASSKAFLNSFIESVHMEVNQFGIKLQALCPGLTETDFHKESDVEQSIEIPGVDLWMSADEVVEASLAGLEKGEVICIPGVINKAVRLLLPVIPRTPYYSIVDKVAKKFR